MFMRIILCLFLLLNVNVNLFAQPIQPSKEATGLQNTFSNIADYYKSRVVSITTEKIIKQSIPQYDMFFGDPFDHFFEDFFEDYRSPRQRRQRRKPQQRQYERKLEGGGTGVVIDEKGYVLTNFHVIDDVDNIKVRFGMDEDETYDAEVVGKDPYTDLAVLKIKSGKTFKFAEMGDSDELKVGNWVIAIGSPFGLEQTVTTGIVSAIRQSMNIEGRRYENFIQTDAAINRGNSGGPLVNIKGEVIGINTAIYAPTGVFSGIGFAIPINQAKLILDDLIEKGKVVRGWLGVEIKEVDEAIAKQFGLKEKYGALINKVVDDSPADKGGVKRGDVILSINGQKMKDISHLQKVVKGTKPGKTIRLMVMRDGVKKALNIKIGNMPDNLGAVSSADEKDDSKEYEWKGITVSSINSQLRQEYNIPEGEKGVVVTKIDLSKAEIGVREGDLIKEINRNKTTTVLEFKKAVKKVDQSDGIVLDIIRRGQAIYITYQGE